jgi:hypothetical protein
MAALIAVLAASPASAQQEPPPGLIPHGDWTHAQVRKMLRLIDKTERVLPERFPTSYSDGGSELEAMGFFNFGATAPGGYDHWINPAWLFDDHTINPRFSESLVYQHTGNGVWELRSAMFMLAPGIDMSEIPDRISWLPGWHGHPELCVRPDGTFGGITDPENPNCPPGTSQATTPLMMHVWLEDPGCGHRFGGVGVTGLHCGHDGHG